MEKSCQNCDKIFTKKRSCSLKDWKTAKFCSQNCYWKSKVGQPAWNSGKKGVQTNFNLSGLQKGWKMNGKQSIGHKPWNKGKIYTLDKTKGQNHWNWKGGVKLEREQARRTPEYREWRQQVFKRDNYTCQFCGERGGRLNADHIKSFAVYPDLRVKISNGRTLCENCHRKTETYGGRTRTGANA